MGEGSRESYQKVAKLCPINVMVFVQSRGIESADVPAPVSIFFDTVKKSWNFVRILQ